MSEDNFERSELDYINNTSSNDLSVTEDLSFELTNENSTNFSYLEENNNNTNKQFFTNITDVFITKFKIYINDITFRNEKDHMKNLQKPESFANIIDGKHDFLVPCHIYPDINLTKDDFENLIDYENFYEYYNSDDSLNFEQVNNLYFEPSLIFYRNINNKYIELPYGTYTIYFTNINLLNNIGTVIHNNYNNESNNCCICLENPAVVKFITCNHIVMCESCFIIYILQRKKNKCPYCRARLH